MAGQRLQILLEKLLQNRIENPELQELKELVNPNTDEDLLASLSAMIEAEPPDLQDLSVEMDRVTRAVLEVDRQAEEKPYVASMRPVRSLHRWKWAAAAIVLCCLGTILWTFNKKEHTSQQISKSKTDIQPGRDGAILTLSNGAQVLLDTIRNGLIALQGGAKATVRNGVLHYENYGTEIVYNTITTPKGRQYQVQLPDGTHVWLNAGSSIRYPTVFAGPEKQVEIKGEAWFDVRKNSKLPFRVIAANKMEVEVLGTEFNINAYENEGKIDATLIDGAIKVNKVPARSDQGKVLAGQGLILKPGQQAIIMSEKDQANNEPILLNTHADIEQVLAWKNGLFKFEDTDLKVIMRQLERWYDVEVVYAEEAPKKTFKGKMPRNAPLSEVLTVLEYAGVKFKLENKRITVIK